MYKVVEVDEKGSLFSTTVNTLENIGVEYKIGVKSYPSIINSKLFCFELLEDAQDFAICFYGRTLEIWECEVENSENCYLIYPISSLTKESHLRAFWNIRRDSIGFVAAPHGTFVCDSITILRKVSWCG